MADAQSIAPAGFFNPGGMILYFIGIDLGTSAVKLLLMDEQGQIKNTVSRSYPLEFPRPGWSQQAPEDWWEATCAGIRALLEGVDASQVRAIGAGGQMHGLVALDEQGRVIRPAILWNDGRTQAQVEYLNGEIGRETLLARTANIAFAGFTAPKLLWMRENEPERFARIARVMLPKDYINYRLTGVHATDYSDASGTLLLDVEHKRWSEPMLALCGLSAQQMPRLLESSAKVGTLLPDVAAALGLPEDVLVCAGAGDNAAAAVGCGVVGEGKCNISLGTSGTVFISSARFCPGGALHSFAHADGGWHLLACILSAASCNQWWMDGILRTSDYDGEQQRIAQEKLGRNDVYYLPYLMGERSPHNNPAARSAFIGMRMDSTREDMTLAVLEGVAFAIRECVEAGGVPIASSTICGGGARSPLWRRILSSVLNIPLTLPVTEQGPSFGGAMLAAVAAGVYPDVAACSRALVRMAQTVEPNAALARLYDARYQAWRALYPALKPVFPAL